MAAKFNKSEIMKKAWRIYRKSFMSFADALRESWKLAKQEIADKAKLAQFDAAFRSEMGAKNYRLNRTYSGCRYGRSDWARDFQNDAKVAINRARDLKRLNN